MFINYLLDSSKQLQAEARAASGNHRRGRHRVAALAIIFVAPLLHGCATLTAAAASKVVTAAGLVSLATTGKGLADHALDMLTRQDCRILDGLLRAERRICEPVGSLATLDDFTGFIPIGTEPDSALLADTSPLESSDSLTLELSNMTGRSAGDVPRPDRLRRPQHLARLELDTVLNHERVPWTSSRQLAGINALMTVLH
jgi:hypothetical protein